MFFNKIIIVISIVILSSFTSIISVYGHGLSSDTSIPVAVNDKQLVVETILRPALIENIDSIDPHFILRFYDESTNTTLSNLNYDLSVKFDEKTLFDGCFESSNGLIRFDLFPVSNISTSKLMTNDKNDLDLSKCIVYQDEKPLQLESQIMTQGGLYHIEILLKQNSQGLSLDKDLKFDLFVSIATIFKYVDSENPSEPLLIKSYYDKVNNINFDRQNNSLSFDMPFNWDFDYLQQMSFLHEEVIIPKSLEFSKTNGYGASINNIALSSRSVIVDDFSDTDNRVVHVLVNKDELDKLWRQLSANNLIQNQNLHLDLYSIAVPKFPLDLLSSTEKYLFQVSWSQGLIEPDVPINFVMNLQDPKTGDLLRHSEFDFIIMDGDTVIHNAKLSSAFGGFAHEYSFPNSISNDVSLVIDNINNDDEKIILDLFIKK
ncbi:MAG: hypothetical protein ACPKPY_10745 [Nitrososphaeraceae archaeon]